MMMMMMMIFRHCRLLTETEVMRKRRNCYITVRHTCHKAVSSSITTAIEEMVRDGSYSHVKDFRSRLFLVADVMGACWLGWCTSVVNAAKSDLKMDSISLV